MLSEIFFLLGETFSQTVSILGYRYKKTQKAKCQLLNFTIGQAKLAIYLSRRNKMGRSL